MILYQLRIDFNNILYKVKSVDFRRVVLALTDSSHCELKSKINFHIIEDNFLHQKSTRKIPYILYGKPYKKSLNLFAYGYDGLELLRHISSLINQKVFINHISYSIKRKKIFENSSLLPKKSIQELTYYTRTPIMIFRHKYRRVFDTILHCNKDLVKRDIEFQKAINDLIVKNLRYQLKTIVKDKEYGFLDDIKLNWQEFKIIKIQNRDSFEPVVVGEFSTDWELPRFIGQRNGDGFGEIIKLNSIQYKMGS